MCILVVATLPQHELEQQAKREEVQRLQEMVQRVQKDAVERIDDLSERTYAAA